MKSSGSKYTTAILLVAWLAVLWFLPLIFSLPCLLIWSFVSVGNIVIDGYVRLITGIAATTLGVWNLLKARDVINESNLVPYAQYMLEAKYFWAQIFVLVAMILAASGIWRLLKMRHNTDEIKDA